MSRALQRRWREAESNFFAQSFAEPGLYEASVKLVRSLADRLRDLTTESDLERAAAERTQDWAEQQLEEMGLPPGDWQDLDLALDAAFNLRLRDLRGEVAARSTADRLAKARAAGAIWLTSAEGDVGFPGQMTFRRVDLHTSAGIALYGYSTRDLDQSQRQWLVQYWLEILPVDKETGTLDRNAPPVRKARAYADREALYRAFDRARNRYAGG